MEIQIAGLRWRVAFEDETAESIIRARYAPYAAPTKTTPLRVLDLVARKGAIAADAKQGNADVTLVRTGDHFALGRLDFRGAIDLASGQTELSFVGLGGIQSFLRVACALYLAPLGGVLVHACSVERDGRAYLFVGESGAGKSTIARLSAPSLILSDEVSAVAPASGGGYRCHATPFWGDLADDVDAQGQRIMLREEPASAPLVRVLFPRKDARDAVVPAARLGAFTSMMREIFVFGDDDETTRAITASCGRIVDQVPVAHLHFRKSAEFWSCLAP
jgi:hypothetical protein